MTPSLQEHAVELLERAGELLRRIEWSGMTQVGDDLRAACPDPDCGVPAPGPHTAACQLARLIGAPQARAA